MMNGLGDTDKKERKASVGPDPSPFYRGQCYSTSCRTPAPPSGDMEYPGVCVNIFKLVDKNFI